MTTIPKALFDLNVRRQIALQRYGNGVVRDVMALLNEAEEDLIAQIRKRGDRGPWTTARLKAVLAEIGDMTFQAYAEAGKVVKKEMNAFADHEAEATASMIETQLPATFSITRPSAAQLAELVNKEPITVGPDKKLLLEEIFTGLAAGKEERIRGAVRLGILEGETVDQMVRRLRGTRAARFTDGIMEVDRRGAAAMVRTIVNHVSNGAAQRTFAENLDVVKGWRLIVTLDGRTTLICSSLAAKNLVYPIGKGPIPPLHVACRSFQLPELKSWRELGIDLDEMPPAVRASKDGPVAADISFNDWLQGQPAAVQKDILGATRQKLFADGMKLDRFTDSKGVVYSLDQLKQRHAEAFEALK